jgi:phosphatidyl-myo-inositol dimannoside synthase
MMAMSLSTSASTTVLGLFPELLGIGGVQESGRQSARALNEIAGRRGWRTEIFSLNDPPGEHHLLVSDHQISFRAFGRRKLSLVMSMIRKGVSVRGDHVQLVVAAHPNLALPAWFMKMLSRGTKTLVMTHGVEVWTRLPSLRWNALLHADLILGPSTDTVQKLIQVQGVAPGKTRKLAWPLNQNFLSLAECPACLKLPQGFPQGRVVLTVGRWAASERYKGLDDLIHATALLRATLPSLHLVVVGQGGDLPRVRKLAIDDGIADFVHFLEHLSCEDLAACYANADVFAMPSSGEGFGLVFLEAMAFAKPIVGAACGGTTDLVEHGVNGLLVPPGDIQKLVEALNGLLSNASFGATLGRRGAQLVREKYNFETFEVELEKILDDLLLAYSTMVSRTHA